MRSIVLFRGKLVNSRGLVEAGALFPFHFSTAGKESTQARACSDCPLSCPPPVGSALACSITGAALSKGVAFVPLGALCSAARLPLASISLLLLVPAARVNGVQQLRCLLFLSLGLRCAGADNPSSSVLECNSERSRFCYGRWLFCSLSHVRPST